MLSSVDLIVGYKTYIDLIRPHFPKASFFQTSMKKEIDRVKAAVKAATQGTRTALVSSGDPGIYALSGLVFEVCKSQNISIAIDNATEGSEDSLVIEIVPGIPALSSCGALLGAPLTHDFAVISLSDLLTPWEVIEKRIRYAAMADFVMVFYNPRSKKRDWQFEKALKIIAEFRSPDTMVGIVTKAARTDQEIHITTLDNVDAGLVGMQTTVFVGNQKTFRFGGFMVTPRGYSDKYEL